MPSERDTAFEFLAGSPSLDFVNTVGWRGRPEPEERLGGYDDLLRWATAAGAIDGPTRARLARRARRQTDTAGRVVAASRRLREAFHRVVMADIEGGRRSPRDLELIAAAANEATRHVALRAEGLTVTWAWEPADDLRRPLWHVARAIATFLGGRARPVVRRCDDEECGWVFIDRSRMGRRRWCSMASCGNRAKARRHYALTKQRISTGRRGGERGPSQGRRRPRRP